MDPVPGPDETADASGASAETRDRGRGALALIEELLRSGRTAAGNAPADAAGGDVCAPRLDVYA
jgi:hypothetical protein